MGNGKSDTKPEDKTESKIDKFVDDLLDDAIEYRAVLRRCGNETGIKERITCLKYLEEIVKTHFILKKASTHDPAAAGSTVRKYAAAFAPKNAVGVGKGRKRAGPEPTPIIDTLDLDGDADTAA